VSIRKANRKEDGISGEARFAAMTLVNDPQAFAERLFHRLSSGSSLKFDTKMLLIQVLSRVVGLHRLHLLHLYPFLQRYVQPNQREVTRLLAAAATACHELVPPDTLTPLLKQLVNQFVHDRARPEVVAVGINCVREICLRCPLVMNTDLLQDLAQYKRARDKPVATAARALISTFRELAPGMLEKKDRGKGTSLFLWFVVLARAARARTGARDLPSMRTHPPTHPTPPHPPFANDEKIIRRRAIHNMTQTN
jgi:protein SDA1|tara:strand:- start:104 stop:859 length:756 start_codon:yes stop_codon:yes gene_type:complete